MRTYYRVVSLLGFVAFIPYVLGVRALGIIVGYAMGTFLIRVWAANESIATR